MTVTFSSGSSLLSSGCSYIVLSYGQHEGAFQQDTQMNDNIIANTSIPVASNTEGWYPAYFDGFDAALVNDTIWGTTSIDIKSPFFNAYLRSNIINGPSRFWGESAYVENGSQIPFVGIVYQGNQINGGFSIAGGVGTINSPPSSITATGNWCATPGTLTALGWSALTVTGGNC